MKHSRQPAGHGRIVLRNGRTMFARICALPADWHGQVVAIAQLAAVEAEVTRSTGGLVGASAHF